MAVFLFGVDWVWSNLLQLIGVLRFRDTSGALARTPEPSRPLRTLRRPTPGPSTDPT